MLVSTLVVAAVAIVAERLIETQFGLAGLIGLLILRTGVSKRNVTCASVGTTVLVMLLLNRL